MSRFSWRPLLAASCVVLGSVGVGFAQVDLRDLPIVAQPQQRFDSGQDIQPVFEGWTRNDDGSFMLHFGYLNRNYREQPNVAIGPNNYFSPGDEDRGQPTFFYPRTQRYQFEVHVPSTMGTSFGDAVVWTVNHNGSEQKAYGWLQAEWEIDELTITSNQGMGRGQDVELLYENRPPTTEVSASATTVKVGEEVTLTAELSDADVPPLLPPRPPRDQIPALKRPENLPPVPDNVTWYQRPRPARNGLSLLWVVYRGPVDVDFEPGGYQRALAEEGDEGSTPPRSGATTPPPQESTAIAGDGRSSATFETTLTFDEPGVYTLRAWASDSVHKAPADIEITVTE